VHLRATLEQERSGRSDGGAARRRARDVYHCTNNDKGDDQPPLFARASQNVIAAAILLRTTSEPSTGEGRQVHNELRGLLECATVQQVESSVSRRCEPKAELPTVPSRQEREALVHPEPRGALERNKAPSVRGHLGDNADAHVILDARRYNKEDGAACRYHLC
jgi:hypothetical protein